MASSINKRIAIGAGWMILLRWTDRLLGLISIAVLARLLLPSDFGLVAYAMVFLAILETFFTFGFETVLIREQDATEHSYNTAWTLNIIRGLVLSVLLVAGSKPVAAFFNEPEVEVILYWIAIFPILRGLENIGIVDFQKNLTLHKDFYFTMTARFTGKIATIILALVLRSYWALVYGMLVIAVFRVILSYVMCDLRPRLSVSEFSKIFGFSKWLLVQAIFSGLNERLPVVVIGRYFNAQALGYFSMGFQLSTLASNELGAPIRRALYPGIAKMQNDNAQMANTLTITLGLIALIGLPATIGIGVTAPIAVPVILGNNWIGVVPILQVLALHATTYILYNNSHVIYYATGRPYITAYLSILRFCILTPMALLVVPDYGGQGAAWALVATNWFVMIVDYLVLFRVTTISLAKVISVLWRSTAAVIIMAICVTFTLENAPTASIQGAEVLHFGYCVATGVVSYVTAISLLWWLSGKPDGPEAHVVDLLKKLFSRQTLGDVRGEN
jgi:O-antigen/teichoic acid export membrane protein